MIPTCFRISTKEDLYYFCARNCNDKWSWIVSIERLLDFKYSGKSPYNSLEEIKTKGFVSQEEYERGTIIKPVIEKPKEVVKPQEPTTKANEQDYEKLVK